MSPLKVFVSYAHENAEYKNDLKKHCALFVEDGDIELWTDDAIRAGDQFDNRIKEEILNADIAILLLSSTYWSKEYIQENELPLILKEKESRNLLIIPILINGKRKIKRTKLKEMSFIPIENNMFKAIEDFEDKEKAWDIIYDEIDKKLEVYTKNKEIEKNKEQEEKIEKVKSRIPQVCIYTASPLNSQNNYDYKKIMGLFKKYSIDLYHKVLNEDSLMDSYDYDINYIFTNSNRNKIIIEDEYFMRKSISLEELEESINFDTITLFLDKKIEGATLNIIDTEIHRAPNRLAGILHKTFKDLKKGKCNFHALGTDLPELIDKSSLTKFIGRNTEIQHIIKNILTIKDENKVFTIKGSGGIGKTTIISKAVIEVAERGKFKNGIKFLQCEYIKDYEEFENKITFAFDMNNAINFKIQLEELDLDEERLIVLDNIETLLYLDDIKEIKKLIKQISDKATIILTSREILNEEYEEVYELKTLSSDEAEELFLDIYTIKKESLDRKLLRDQILDEYLNNNPLAIKLVTKNLPKGKDLNNLIRELKDKFFNITSEDIEKIFSEESDLNIERTKSLFQSINYSYQKLSDKEKLALEILSLFPDGMNLENFIKFYNKDMKNHKIKKQGIKNRLESFSDRDIKALADKSLILITNQTVSLQSIIGRFSDYKFAQKDQEEKVIFYKKAYEYNIFINTLIKDVNQSALKARIFDINKNNFIKNLEYLKFLEKDNSMYMYISSIIHNFAFFSASHTKVEQKLLQVSEDFKGESLQVQKFFKIMILSLKYFSGDFENIFNEIQISFPLDQLKGYMMVDGTFETSMLLRLIAIYGFEGYALEELKNEVLNDVVTLSSCFLVGEYNIAKAIAKSRGKEIDFDFFEFELLSNTHEQNISVLKKYISTLYKTEHIEKMQATYTLIKEDINEVSEKDIKNLISVNPFTDGLKSLMMAMKRGEKIDKEKYEEAIDKLYHIRYYYVEAILLYSKHLSKSDDPSYEVWEEKGKTLAEKHYYRYLLHQFICLKNNEYIVYDEKNYPLPEKFNYSKIIKNMNLDISID